MKYNFEEYHPIRGRNPGPPQINIRPNGAVFISAAAMNSYVKKKQFAILHYDFQNKVIAFELLDKKRSNAYTICSRFQGSSMGLITIMGFIKQYSIQPGLYPVELDPKTEFLIADLKTRNKKANTKN